MVDISDVTDALAGLCGAAVYPDGESQPSVTAAVVKIYAGWPNEAALAIDLAAGASHVSVFNMPKMDKDMTLLDDGWMELPGPTPSYGLNVLGNTLTVTGGPPSAPQVHNFALAFGGPAPILYSPPDGRTAVQVATDLLALLTAAGISATRSGADITVSPLFRIGFARVGTIGSAVTEVSRAEKGFMVSIWAPSPEARSALGKAIKPALDAVPFLGFTNDYSARIKPAGAGGDRDDAARPGVYRRDLIYSVEVPTTLTVAAPEIVAFTTDLKTPDGAEIVTVTD